MSTAPPASVPVLLRQPGATNVGQAMPTPNSLAPSLFSVFRLASNCHCREMTLEKPRPRPVRLIFRSMSPPVPGPPSSGTTWGAVAPPPISAVLGMYGSSRRNSR